MGKGSEQAFVIAAVAEDNDVVQIDTVQLRSAFDLRAFRASCAVISMFHGADDVIETPFSAPNACRAAVGLAASQQKPKSLRTVRGRDQKSSGRGAALQNWVSVVKSP